MKLVDLTPITAKYYLVHPVTKKRIKDDKKQEVYWNVVGRDSDEYVGSQQEFLQYLEKLGNKANKLTAIDYKKHASKQLVAMVKGWDSKFDDFHGGAYTVEKVELLLGSPTHNWIIDGLDNFVAERENFFVK